MKDKILKHIIHPLRNYTLDQQELGRILIIFSLTLIVLSSYGVYQLTDLQEMTQETHEDLEGVGFIVTSDRFQSAIDSLDRSGMTVDGQPISEIADDFEYIADTAEDVEEMDSTVENTLNTFQWMIIFGILGLAAGVALIYV